MAATLQRESFQIFPEEKREKGRKNWVKGILLEVDRNNGEGGFHLKALPVGEGRGTPLWWSGAESITWAYWGARDPRVDCKDVFSPEWIRGLMSRPEKDHRLSGVYTFIGIDHQRNEAIVIGDRLAIQAVHFGEDESGVLKISTHLMWLLWELNHPGHFDREGFLSQVCYGYPVDPEHGLYQGIRKLAPGSYLKVTGSQCAEKRYWKEPDFSDQSQIDVPLLADSLRKAMIPPSDGDGAFLGLTAGKDSLCLASLIPPESPNFLTGTFGADQCADRLQAAKIASDRGWEHRAGELCPAEEFADWASRIAFDSAGTTTCSYVDMARFIEKDVPLGWTFVIGEGGECVRDFFTDRDQNPVERIKEKYMTPYPYLEETLVPELVERLNGYPEKFFRPMRAAIPEEDDERFALQFYRQKRMPGNFSQRHAVLATIRPKISPFLDNEFIDHSWESNPVLFEDSKVHEQIIQFGAAEYLDYFGDPECSDISAQEWPARFLGATGQEIFSLLSKSLPYCPNVFKPDGVVKGLNNSGHASGRKIYYLLRILSIALAQRQLHDMRRISQSPFKSTPLSQTTPGMR